MSIREMFWWWQGASHGPLTWAAQRAGTWLSTYFSPLKTSPAFPTHKQKSHTCSCAIFSLPVPVSVRAGGFNDPSLPPAGSQGSVGLRSA